MEEKKSWRDIQLNIPDEKDVGAQSRACKLMAGILMIGSGIAMCVWGGAISAAGKKVVQPFPVFCAFGLLIMGMVVWGIGSALRSLEDQRREQDRKIAALEAEIQELRKKGEVAE